MTSSYQHPFQKLCCVGSVQGCSNLLLAAAGPHVFSFDLGSGELLARWPSKIPEEDDSDATEERIDENSGEPPNKKRKIASSTRQGESSDSSLSVEIVAERAKGQRRKPRTAISVLPKVSHLIATRNRKHVVAVTTEDKCIRVFEIRKGARLKLLSERCMPKRLCAIVFAQDQSTILAADKFGDVYSLPLIVSSTETVVSVSTAQEKSAVNFRPSASELTVHTKGNREALRQQQEQKAAAKTKESPTFEHKLLLGHVSLLTDLIAADVNINGKKREYILTADRDEHVRVSRGPSQAHVIETYCLGHKEFVSKLCILPWQDEVLVTGSGEPSIKTFHWLTGNLIGDLSLSDVVQDAISGSSIDILESKPLQNLATSGLWPMKVQYKAVEGKEEASSQFVLVAFEGLPLLVSLEVSPSHGLVHHQTINLQGNVLDVVFMEAKQAMVVSMDNVHEAGSVKIPRTDPLGVGNSLVAYQLGPENSEAYKSSSRGSEPQRWRLSDYTEALFDTIVFEKDDFPKTDFIGQTNPKATYSALGEFLYGLENLRKNRSGHEAGENGAGGQDDVEVPAEDAE